MDPNTMTDPGAPAAETCAYCDHAQADLAQQVAWHAKLENQYRGFIANGWAIRDSERSKLASAALAIRLRRVFLRLAQTEHPNHPADTRDSLGYGALARGTLEAWCKDMEAQLDAQHGPLCSHCGGVQYPYQPRALAPNSWYCPACEDASSGTGPDAYPSLIRDPRTGRVVDVS